MLKDKIIKYFNKFPQLRVLFFFDKEQAYLEELNLLNLDTIQIVQYQNNPFTLKNELLTTYRDSRVLLYLPMSHPSTQEELQNFHLLGLLIANKELQLNDVGDFMEDYGLQRHQKALVGKYIEELKYTGVQQVVKPILNAASFNEANIKRALVSAFLKFKEIESWSLITAKFVSLLEKQDTSIAKIAKKIKKLHFEDEVVKRIKEITNTNIQELSVAAMQEVARGILYNKLTQTITQVNAQDPYSAYKITDQTQLTRLNQMLHDVERNAVLKPKFEKALESITAIKGEKLIAVYGLGANFAELTTPMIWTMVEQLQVEIVSNPAKAISQLEKISLQANLEKLVKQSIKYFIKLSKMYQYLNKIDTYILDNPDLYIQQYTQHWHKIDYTYRKAITQYKELSSTDIPTNIQIEDSHAAFNKAYDAHTNTLNREWLKCLNSIAFDYQQITAAKQYHFYKNNIETLSTKVVVLISDALRYEVATELLSQMHGDAKNTAKMGYMLASIPSKTNVGMAQLLPGSDKTFEITEIKSEGISTSGTENRTKILKHANPASLAIQYSELEGLSQAEKRAVFKNSVVYVYHDVIDAIGHKKASERRTFTAVKDAITDLKVLVKNLHASYNVSKVIITADHGFIYNDVRIADKDLESFPIDNTASKKDRYFITNKKIDFDLGYSVPLSATSIFKKELFINIPLSVNRYKLQGASHQFTHGGGSLQELVLPLIESTRQREKVTKKVVPVLIANGVFKIVSNIIKINLLQETAISRLEKERTITVGLYKGTNLVSNKEIVLLNASSELPSERMHRVTLTLAPEAVKETFLKLKIFDVEDTLNTLIEERVQNNTLIQTDF